MSEKNLNFDCYKNVKFAEADPYLIRFVKEHCSLQAKLDIAVKDLETIVNACDMRLPRSGISYVRPEYMFIDSIRTKAQEALAKIKRGK